MNVRKEGEREKSGELRHSLFCFLYIQREEREKEKEGYVQKKKNVNEMFVLVDRKNSVD